MSVVAFSIGKDPRKDKSVNKTAVANPGPGTYSPPSNNRYKKQPSVSMGTSVRRDMADPQLKKVPGPGNYEDKGTLAEQGKRKGISFGGKMESVIHKLPGPGEYNPKAQEASPQITMKSRTKVGTSLAVSSDGGHQKLVGEFDTSKVPGPGTYKIDGHSVFKNNGSCRFGTGARQGLATAGAQLIPGPSQYARDSKTAVLKASPRFGFGTSTRTSIDMNKAKLPGPGSYTCRSNAFAAPGRTILGRVPDPKTSNMYSPPPGTYVQKGIFDSGMSPSWRMGTAHRDVAHRMMSRTCNFPPPDTYNPDYTAAAGKKPVFSFSKTTRMSQTPSNKQPPGPGTYAVPSKAIEGNKTSMGLKLDNFGALNAEARKTRGIPGAGTYNGDFSKVAKNNGAFTMRAKNNLKENNVAPGPGAYGTKEIMGKTAPSFGFGCSAQREGLPKQRAPGPGGYKVPCAIGQMPAYTNARPKDFGYI